MQTRTKKHKIAEEIFQQLAGNWTLYRFKNNDKIATANASFHKMTDYKLIYQEEGKLNLDNAAPLDFFRRYAYCLIEGRIQVFFLSENNTGNLFHTLNLNSGLRKAEGIELTEKKKGRNINFVQLNRASKVKKEITTLFCFVHDFYKVTEEWLKTKSLEYNQNRTPTRKPELSLPEIMTIILLYHQSPCKNFKYFYHSYLQLYKKEFPSLVSYNRFIELKSRSLVYLALLLQWYIQQATETGISYIDSTSIAVCHPKRISRNKVFAGIAKIGKTTKGWFLGLKLHIVINERGELQGVKFTAGNVDDRAPVQSLTKLLTGLLFGDKGYIKQELFQSLYDRRLKLVTGIRKGMKNQLMGLFEKVLLRKRSVVETVFDILKYYFELEHTRHRSILNAFVHLVSTLIAYCLKPTKPSITQSFLIPN